MRPLLTPFRESGKETGVKELRVHNPPAPPFSASRLRARQHNGKRNDMSPAFSPVRESGKASGGKTMTPQAERQAWQRSGRTRRRHGRRLGPDSTLVRVAMTSAPAQSRPRSFFFRLPLSSSLNARRPRATSGARPTAASRRNSLPPSGAADVVQVPQYVKCVRTVRSFALL